MYYTEKTTRFSEKSIFYDKKYYFLAKQGKYLLLFLHESNNSGGEKVEVASLFLA